MKTSKHSRMRMRERTDLNHNERRMLFRNALDKGKSKQEIKNPEIRDFISKKDRHCKVKLYNDYIFIYSKVSKQLYTMYKLPNNLLGKEEYR